MQYNWSAPACKTTNIYLVKQLETITHSMATITHSIVAGIPDWYTDAIILTLMNPLQQTNQPEQQTKMRCYDCMQLYTICSSCGSTALVML